MFYYKRNKPKLESLQKTFTESEERQYKSDKIYLGQRAYITLLISFILAALILSTANGFLEAKDGAGDNWSCSYCGYSNKFYEMCCRNCGRWR